MPVSAVFAQLLAAGRRAFNARADEARRRAPGFDLAAFAVFLQDRVDGVVVAVDAVAPGRVREAAEAAYEVALELGLHGTIGAAARRPALDRAWTGLFPRLALRIAEQPQRVLGALSNAVLHLDGADGGRSDDWLAWMGELAPQAATVDQLLDLGQLLAWRAGLAQYRAGALAAADRLAPALQLAALGAPADGVWHEVRAAIAADPWAAPGPRRVEGWQLGAFTGFGGRFAQPPELRVAPAGGFVVRSGERHFLAIADAHGAVLLPATVEEYAAAALPRPLQTPRYGDRRLVYADREVELDLPADGLTLASDGHTLAVASPYAHVIRLLPA